MAATSYVNIPMDRLSTRRLSQIAKLALFWNHQLKSAKILAFSRKYQFAHLLTAGFRNFCDVDWPVFWWSEEVLNLDRCSRSWRDNLLRLDSAKSMTRTSCQSDTLHHKTIVFARKAISDTTQIVKQSNNCLYWYLSSIFNGWYRCSDLIDARPKLIAINLCDYRNHSFDCLCCRSCNWHAEEKIDVNIGDVEHRLFFFSKS